MSLKGTASKVKRSTLLKGAKIAKANRPIQNVNTLTKVEKHRARHEGWTRRLDALSQVQKKKTKSPPPLAMDALSETLNCISAAPVPSTSSTPAHPLLLQARSETGRKNALMKETAQFRKVLLHPAYQKAPAEAIGMHLRNTMESLKKSLAGDSKRNNA